MPLNIVYSGYSMASCGNMLASMISSVIHLRPLTRPMPSAYALNMESTTASSATRPEVQTLFHTFSGKFTRSQKVDRPVKLSSFGHDSGPEVL